MSVRTGSTTAFRVPSAEPAAPECTSLSCTLGDLLTEPGVATAAVVAGIAALIAFAYVRDARTACERERRRVLDERDAFERFADRVAAFDPAPTDATATEGPVASVHQVKSGSGTDVTLQRVLRAYRDTVMSLSHYGEEYDETVAESLSAELGTDTATSLATNRTLSAAAQTALVDRSRHAAAARESLADGIDAELDALSDAESRLSRIDRQRRRLLAHLEGIDGRHRTDASIDVWNRLDELEDECDAAAADRQQTLRNPPLTADSPATGEDDTDFYRYLYGSLDGPQYPVLAQITDLADRLRDDRDRVAQGIVDPG
ncbi:hypothetical protein GJ633_03590 [Halorubrum sp. CBA1125]|uniref:DUF7260 family protein n=1 Tax=Halorubrum sp. CBA1125 TaxID=2668072 RepID=UPI0012E9300A|nr:hypothetical protein [Halorubrum sp. CBA1125]MUW13849.1 hypothetical protein [Halorubrum sp. CBA1125]